MAIREILEVPNPLLKQVSAPVEIFDEELKTLVDDMLETMYDAPGIGLAAIQIGVAKRVVVIDLQDYEDEDEDNAENTVAAEDAAEEGSCGDPSCGHDHGPQRKIKYTPRVFINPVLSDPSEDYLPYQEGCLSVPDIYAPVDRPATVHVRWQNLDGSFEEEAMDGLMATCIQHEMDHLEGILFIDHLSRLKRNIALKKLEKARRAA